MPVAMLLFFFLTPAGVKSRNPSRLSHTYLIFVSMTSCQSRQSPSKVRHVGPFRHARMDQNSGNLAASTHMSVLSCPGHPEHVGASCHPAAGVQIQGGDGSHPPESGRPPDHHGGQRAQLPERAGRHPNGSLFACLLVRPARRRGRLSLQSDCLPA